MSDYEDAESEYDEDFIDDEDADSDQSEVKNSKRKKASKGTKGKKKAKKAIDGRAFLELYAAEDDEDEEGSDDELSENEKKMAERQRKQLEHQYKRRTEGPAFLNAYDEGENIDEYFKHRGRMEEAGEDNELALLPTPSDPKLFVIKCKPNEEREACLQVMKKYFDCLGTQQEFQIFSCTSIDKTEGYIYIEAYSDKHVYVAIANIPIIYGSKITLVSFADRTQIFESDPTKNIEVKIGQWVRVKKGLYDGDLAQVEDLDEARSRVLVKLVPRLSPETEENDHDDDEEKKAGQKKGEHLQRARKAGNGIKPPQRLFQENDYQNWTPHRDAERGLSFIMYKNNRYCDGLLYKWFPLKNLITQNITVNYEESKFFTIGDNTDPNVLNTLIDQAGAKATKFFKGDRIRVIKGDMMNLEAEILKINPVQLTVRPINSEVYTDSLEISPGDCVKSFNKGEYVRVVEGKNAGKEGFIMLVEDNVATVMSDGLQNMIQVFVNDLVFCNESTRNIEVKGKKDKEMEQEYVKFDLIKLNDRKTVGIVLGTATNGWKILDNFGNVRNVITYQIEQKLNTRNNLTKNDKGQTFRLNDSVRILQGKYKGQTGIAKHIYSDLIFIYNPDVTQNMGVIIEKANNCFLLSAQRQNGKPAGPKGKDTLMGKKCAIKSGPWKGYQGIVKDGNERTIRMLLTSKCQIIDVKRELVIPLEDIGKATESNEGRAPIVLEPKTPMISKSLQSPFFSMNSPGFENSPAWGFESPAYDAHLK